MQVKKKEVEEPQTADLKKPENTEKQEESKPSNEEDDSIVKDSKFESVIVDVSGKNLDYHVLDDDDEGVETLYMYKNELNMIPRAVGKLKGLKTMKFFGNEVNLFPRELGGRLVGLECLQVKVASPGVSGLEVSKMRHLKELELSRVPDRPSAFPILTEIAGLKCLTRLSVCHFSIRYLPPEIGCLRKLEYLDLSFNKMKHLPDEITSLKSLVALKVPNNKLVELPSGLESLQNLEDLDLSNNRLTSLGCLHLQSMHNLQILNLQNNKLPSALQIPSWICCIFGESGKDISNDESVEMDVYEGDVEEIQNNPSSGITQSAQLTGLSPDSRSLAARRSKVRKWRYNMQPRTRQERLSYSKKWKNDASIQKSSKKCMACKKSISGYNSMSEGFSACGDSELDNKDTFTQVDMCEHSLIDMENDCFGPEKDSVIDSICSCSVLDSVGVQKKVDGGDSSESGAVLDSLAEAVEVQEEGSSSESSKTMPKSKRHSEKELDNPKPTKTRRPTNDPSYISCQYSKISFCGVDDYLSDGFYDAGRDRPLMPLRSYEQHLHLDSREVILVDRENDEELDAILLRARRLVYHLKRMNGEQEYVANDTLQTASLLALFVSDHFGGSDRSDIMQRTRKDVSGSNYRKPFVCTCPTGTGKEMKQSMGSVDDNIDLLDLCEKSVRSIKAKRNSNIVPIGGLKFGVCRHRAVLMKYLCDRMEPRLPCELVRGYLDFSAHAWNVILMKKSGSWVRMVVDACHPHDIREETDQEYFCRYVPLSRMRVPVASDGDPNSNCSFPSLSVCDEFGKVMSTTLMRCNIGSREAAVKVRTLEACGTSAADEIRNFEFSCLGEVRMLSILKHSCIVECYGHQISCKWSQQSEDGNAGGGRILQSAILMEYIEGGSLKSYLEKLSRDGEKHVAVELVLSIARDVASALAEVHSRDIIHRDIKSDNILIDLDKKKPDGTPTVKICDFDRAVPLRASSHTCCIAHVGIPEPKICVGTPRWMAPEVFHAMHKHNLYGLEVDIWSFGCVLLELLTLQVPYSGLPESEIHNYLQMGQRPRLTDELEALAQSDSAVESESETLRFLVKLYHKCTEKNPSDRPTAGAVYDLLLARASSITNSSSAEQD